MDSAQIRKTAQGVPGWTDEGATTERAVPAFAEAMSQARARLPGASESPYHAILDEVKRQLVGGGRLNPAAYDQPSDEDFNLVHDLARGVIRAHDAKASSAGRAALLPAEPGEYAEALDRLSRRMADDILGWGPIAPYMQDEAIEEIFINGHDQVYAQRVGEPPRRVNARFLSPNHLRVFINRKLDHGEGGRGVTFKTPWRDHRLADGSRVHVVMTPLVANLGEGAIAITIRRFRSVARTIDDLLRLGAIPLELAALLRAAMRAQLNIVISGGTGSGKTTFLTALASEIDAQDRVVTVEDTPELKLDHLPNWVALVTREAGEEAREVTMADNVRHCLRMRPRRIVLGEARGAEVIAILQAMNTGHEGTLFTVHADDAYRTLQRIEDLYLMGGLGNVPLLAIRRTIAHAIHLIINIGMFQDSTGCSTRRVREVAYVTGSVEGDLIAFEPLFTWKVDPGREPSSGRLAFTGAHPSGLIARLEARTPGFNWRSVMRGAQ